MLRSAQLGSGFLMSGCRVRAIRCRQNGVLEILEIAPNGYVDHEFPQCERGRKYGIRWLWDKPSQSATIEP